MNKNKQKNRGLAVQGSRVVTEELSGPCAGGTLMGQENGLAIQKYWSPGGLLWPREDKVSRPVAPSHGLGSPFIPVHSGVKKIGKRCMRGW